MKKKAAGVIVKCEKTGKILLGKRSKEVSEPLTWGCFGGMIEDGEVIKSGAKREFFEETQVTLKNIVHVHTFSNMDIDYYTHICSSNEEFDVTLCWENDDYGWFDMDDLPSPLHPNFEKVLFSNRVQIFLSMI